MLPLARAQYAPDSVHVRRVHIDSLIAIDEWPVSSNQKDIAEPCRFGSGKRAIGSIFGDRRVG